MAPQLSEGRKLAIFFAIVYMICVDGLPLSMVEKPGFKFLMHTLEPSFPMPSRKKVTDFMKKLYHSGVEGVSGIVKGSKISLTLDLATILNSTRSFMVVSAHILDSTTHTLVRYTLGATQIFFSHTANNIRDQLQKLLCSFGITNSQIQCATTDGGANIVKATEDEYGKTRHCICVTHYINLIVQHSISIHKILQDALMKLKRLVTFFKLSSKSTDELKQLQKKAKRKSIFVLIQSVDTRWNSAFICVRRFLLLKSFVSTVVQNRAREQANLTKKRLPEMPTLDEIMIFKDFEKLYSPFYIATVCLSGEKYPTSNLVIPVLRQCTISLTEVEPQHQVGKEIKTYLVKKMLSVCEEMEANLIFSKATLLDPRCKRLAFQSPMRCSNTVEAVARDLQSLSTNDLLPQAEKVQTKLEKYIEKMQKRKNASTATPPIARPPQFDRELTEYLNEDLQLTDCNPLEYWHERRNIFPKLYTLAVSNLLAMASSTASERIVSSVNHVACNKRSSLTSNNINALVCLRSINSEVWDIVQKKHGKFNDCPIPKKKIKLDSQPDSVAQALKRLSN